MTNEFFFTKGPASWPRSGKASVTVQVQIEYGGVRVYLAQHCPDFPEWPHVGLLGHARALIMPVPWRVLSLSPNGNSKRRSKFPGRRSDLPFGEQSPNGDHGYGKAGSKHLWIDFVAAAATCETYRDAAAAEEDFPVITPARFSHLFLFRLPYSGLGPITAKQNMMVQRYEVTCIQRPI